MSRLLIFDTSNFVNFPIGGQLTSIGNFLRYICEEHPERTVGIMLIGTTLVPEEVGKIKKIELYGRKIEFLPVVLAEKDLGNTTKSLRLQYVKGLLRNKKNIKIKKWDCCYIHAPEAYGIVKLFCRRSQCVIFSHGSYFNMEKGFRFFKKNVLIVKGFVAYLKWLLKSADMILLLDNDSMREYTPYNSNLIKVGNSIVCPDIPEERHILKDGEVTDILFVGRLSKDKRVEPIIEAVKGARESMHLTIVGDGEEYRNLIKHEGDRVHFVGAVTPKEVKEYLKNSDILVMNSAFEGIPMTILEAISYALPVVSTNVGGIGSVLQFGLDSEETDGTSESIREAIYKIEKYYDAYSGNAYRNSKAFDYRRINQKVYDLLCNYWKV